MTMDEFSAPLGQNKMPRQQAPRVSVSRITMGVGVLAAALVAGWVMTMHHPLGGVVNVIGPEPEVTRPVANAPATPSGAEQPAREGRISNAVVEPVAPAPAAGMRTVTIIDGMSGKRREVVIPETSPVVGFDQQMADPPLPTAAALGAGKRAPARPQPVR